MISWESHKNLLLSNWWEQTLVGNKGSLDSKPDKYHFANRLLIVLLVSVNSNSMKRILVTIKKKVDPTHKLITTEWVTEEELKAIRKKYGNQFDPEEPIIQYLSDQLVMVSFLVWMND